ILGSRIAARADLRTEGIAKDLIAFVLSKPVKPSLLFNRLQATLESARLDADCAEDSFDSRLAERLPLRLLVAEDNPVNQRVIERFLERIGYRADIVANGLEALASLGSHAYDAVLLDVHMPEMDGLEVARRVGERFPHSTRPRLIAMTASAMSGDRETCLAAGMDDYISKPLRMQALQDALERCAPDWRAVTPAQPHV
ncbi:MAG: response regulator, partial [Bryobacteraceae bacterium]